MKTNLFSFLLIFFWTSSQAYILPSHPVKSYTCGDECNKLSHEKLHANWSINSLLNLKTNKQYKSYSYNVIISARQLNQGFHLATQAPGAVIRITPLQKRPLPELLIKPPRQSYLALKTASVRYAQDESLSDALVTPPNQTIMQIKPELGYGSFLLQSKPAIIHDADKYSINVFDKYSQVYLEIKPYAFQYQYGDEYKADIFLNDNEHDYNIGDIHAVLISPDETSFPLKLTLLERNLFQASATLHSEVNTRGENWSIEVDISNKHEGEAIRRAVRSSFSYSIPSASLLSIKKIAVKPLAFAAEIEVATASRYVLQAVLYHRTGNGLVPIETSQTAQWLEPGMKTIQFNFDNSKHLDEDTLSVGYLHLTDYGQLKTVYQYNQPIQLSELMD